MSPQEAEKYFELAMEKWQQANDSPHNGQANGLYQTASGYLNNITQAGLANEEILGVITMFYYDYAIFFAQRLKNGRESEKQLVVAESYAKSALTLNPHQLDVRIFKALLATDFLVTTPKPNTLNTLLGGGGWFKKGFDVTADLTSYNRVKKDFNEAVLALATAFQASTKSGMTIESCVETVERMLQIVDGVFEHDVQVRPILEAITAVNYSTLQYYSSEDVLESLILNIKQIQMDAKARLTR